MKANNIINLLSQYGKINGDEKHISMQKNGVVYEAMLNDTNTTNVVYVTYNKGEKTEFTSFYESLRAIKDVIEQNIRENR